MRSWAVLDAVVELALPRCCAGCGRAGVALCTRCRAEVHTVLRSVPERTAPQPVPDGFPPTWSQTAYEGVTAALLKAYKDGDRSDLVDMLARLLRPVLSEALLTDPRVQAAALDGRLVVVPVPSAARARRRRGRDPVADIVRSALRRQRVLARATPLRVRGVQDQAGLDAGARAANLVGSMSVRSACRRSLDGAVCIVVDDIVTTGATLVEARRALEQAGTAYVVAVTIAATQRHRPPRS